MKKVSLPRILAIKILKRVYRGAYSNLELNAQLRKHPLNSKDVGLLTKLVYGVLQHRYLLRYDLSPFLKRPRRLPLWLLILFETALYQMVYLDRVPDRAVLDDSIQIAKQRGNQGDRRLMTGVLHQVLRQGLPQVSRIKNPLRRRSIRFSVPEWLIKRLDRQVGEVKNNLILSSLNQPAKVAVRINTARITMKEAERRLVKVGYQVKASQLAGHGLILRGGRPVYQSSAFKDGWLTIQDESAMLPVEIMPIQKDDRILDACAAPGGKTCQIAERLNREDGGRVIALDLHPNRLRRVLKNAQRLQVSDRIATRVLDARKVNTAFADQSFNQILVDAPCSGLGLIRNKPEIRYFKSLRDVKKLHKIQVAILDAMAPKLKVGGHLIYSTCTIVDAENADTVKEFLNEHPNYHLNPIRLRTSVHGHRSVPELQLYPDDFKSDGFFISDLVRVK